MAYQGLKVLSRQPLPLKFWDYGPVPPCPAQTLNAVSSRSQWAFRKSCNITTIIFSLCEQSQWIKVGDCDWVLSIRLIAPLRALVDPATTQAWPTSESFVGFLPSLPHRTVGPSTTEALWTFAKLYLGKCSHTPEDIATQTEGKDTLKWKETPCCGGFSMGQKGIRASSAEKICLICWGGVLIYK